MPRRPSASFLVLVALVGATACGAVRVAGVGGRVTDDPITRTRPGMPPRQTGGPPADPRGPETPRGDLPGPASGTRYAAERRMCRTSGVPRGWVAVAYVEDSQCPARTGADSMATSMVLTRHTGWPRGTELEVCADQRTPSGWERVPREDGVDATACPGAARAGEPTTRLIRRYR
ncbi:hypothetical protein [Roseisolibacter agri]|uniref:Uncharacterized protein n=1 Tax=Roseisolibacter agri TaxID=2014610 RepID=A0AA37Q5V3_9BACT|nr:hypothetical protein [Roseisolibacter agri]GLC23521.1 hypothetical protein rosag_00340 [Roseisolibacter agri]